MGSRLVTVIDAAMMKKVRRFRYEVYVQELRFNHPHAHHVERELYDDLDDHSTVFALTDEREAVVATLRCTLLTKVSTSDEIVEKFSMQPFVDRFSTGALATTSRFMFRPDQRKTTDILKLLNASISFGLAEGIRFNFGDTNAVWLDYFEQLGYRRFAKPVNDPIFGYHLPIVMLIRDRWYLRAARSPTLRYVSAADDDSEARNWFNERFAQFAPRSPVTRNASSLVDLASSTGFDIPAVEQGHLGRLPDHVRADMILSSSMVEFYPGDTVSRAGEIDETVYVCLSGSLAVAGTSRWIGPGDLFGLEEKCARPLRRSTITAQSHGLLLIMPARRLRTLSARHEAVGPWLQALSGD